MTSPPESAAVDLRSFTEQCHKCGQDDTWSEVFYRNHSTRTGEIYWRSNHECPPPPASGSPASGETTP